MVRFKLEIDTTDRQLSVDITGGQADSASQKVEVIPGKATLEIDHLIKRYTIEVPETIVAILNVGKDVAVGLVAAWLYDTLKGRAQNLRIEETEVRLEKDDIEVAIKHKIEEKES